MRGYLHKILGLTNPDHLEITLAMTLERKEKGMTQMDLVWEDVSNGMKILRRRA